MMANVKKKMQQISSVFLCDSTVIILFHCSVNFYTLAGKKVTLLGFGGAHMRLYSCLQTIAICQRL